MTKRRHGENTACPSSRVAVGGTRIDEAFRFEIRRVFAPDTSSAVHRVRVYHDSRAESKVMHIQKAGVLVRDDASLVRDGSV